MIEVGLFAEDVGHQSLLVPLIKRIAGLEGVEAEVLVRNAQGGLGAAVTSLKQYVRDQQRGVEGFHDILVPAIDANCTGTANRRREIERAVGDGYAGDVVMATPEPHIELWYIADPKAIGRVLGEDVTADVPPIKCERRRYKVALREAFHEAGVETLADGVEYGEDIAAVMDLGVAAGTAVELGSFVDDLRGAFRRRSHGS